MKIDFDSIEEKRFPEFKGGTGAAVMKVFEDEHMKVMNGWLETGSSIGMHTHEGNCEVTYVLSGIGKMVVDGVDEPLKAGSCTYCPEGHTHSLVNTGDEPLHYLGIVNKKK